MKKPNRSSTPLARDRRVSEAPASLDGATPRPLASKRMSPSWQVQTAKARFSEVFRRARNEGPQRITRQGKDGVVMISQEEYEQLTATAHQPNSLVEFFRQSPLAGVNLDLKRDRDPGRDVRL